MSGPEENAIILLAAGESSRMGKPKQLLQVRNKTLLRHAAEEAIHSQLGPLVVVLGAFGNRMETELKGLQYERVMNEDWQEGMGSSIRVGIQCVLQKHSHCRGAIIMLCDQPYVDVSHLDKLVHTYRRSHKPIIASTYKGILGVPAYFHHSYFGLLEKLDRTTGARKLIQQYSQDAGAVPFPLGGIDVDTPKDYQMLKDKLAREEGVD
jgi:molybdenum cofactor cytidylyltransferase